MQHKREPIPGAWGISLIFQSPIGAGDGTTYGVVLIIYGMNGGGAQFKHILVLIFY
jgi:hypothetical protein